MNREPLYITKYQARMLDSAMKTRYTLHKAVRNYRKYRAMCNAHFRYIVVCLCCSGVWHMFNWPWTINHMLIVCSVMYIVNTIECVLSMQYIKLMRRMISAFCHGKRRILVKE